MRTSKLLLTLFGALVALVGIGAMIAGGALLWAHGTQRTTDQFYSSPEVDLETSTHALLLEELHLGIRPGDWMPGDGELAFRITATAVDDEAIFVGVAPQDELRAWLDDVAHERITRFGVRAGDVATSRSGGDTPGVAPAEADFWAATAEGDGTQSLTWEAERGSWAAVVMNADGSPGVAVEATGGIRTDIGLPIGLALLIGGLVVLAIGAAMILAGVAGTGRPEDEEAATSTAPAASGPGAMAPVAATTRTPGHPVTLEARLDPQLSRWQWLVKWFLAIPHLLVLALLWTAFVVLTFVAGVAILFTGRYPRSIFDFNVGVLRWTWRVTAYAFGLLSTDRYPPFTLAPDPDYPTTLDVVYPARLSRGLVLVKWWLLAIPHYLIVGVLTGSIVSWTFDLRQPEGWQATAGGGLIGVLVIVAALMLLFRGRYPQGLFDLVVGLQRWVYRVVAYAALMTDDYPPFRLDTGGSEPGPQPSVPPPPPPSTGGTPEDRPTDRPLVSH